MSAHGNPDIIEDGLVLCLDAANKKSYSGSGTTWTDRSGNGNDGTLTNGAVFSSLGGGSTSTDGIDDYVDLGNDSSLDISGAFSLEIFFYGGSGIDSYGGLLNKASSGNFGNWGLYGDANNNYVRFGFRATNGSQEETSNSNYNDISTEAWVHYLGVYTGEVIYLYRNGIQIGTKNVSLNSRTQETNSYNAAIGRRLANNGYEVDFKVSVARVYNKALTVDEVLQNFNATKSRFGL